VAFGPSVSIIILNWNGLEDTLRCLESVSRINNRDYRIDIVVVDNGSDQDPTHTIKSRLPQVEIMRLPDNRGFAEGCNAGIRLALARDAKFICLLNNDTLVETDFLTPLLESFDANENLGIVSPVIREMTTPGHIEFAGGTVNYALGRFIPRRVVADQSGCLRLCDYASGCCMLINRRTLEEVGLFDEAFFAYFEDTDFSIRAREKGFKVGCCLESSIRHKGSATTRAGLTEGTTSPLKHYLVARNRLILMRKHAPVWSRIFFLTIVQPICVTYYLAAFIIRHRVEKARAFLSGIRDGLLDPTIRPRIDKWR